MVCRPFGTLGRSASFYEFATLGRFQRVIVLPEEILCCVTLKREKADVTLYREPCEKP